MTFHEMLVFFIRILTMAYYNLYITGVVQSPTVNKQGFGTATMIQE